MFGYQRRAMSAAEAKRALHDQGGDGRSRASCMATAPPSELPNTMIGNLPLMAAAASKAARASS